MRTLSVEEFQVNAIPRTPLYGQDIQRRWQLLANLAGEQFHEHRILHRFDWNASPVPAMKPISSVGGTDRLKSRERY